MKCEIITVGTEILMGQILNTNARFISQHLAAAGVDQYYQTTVGDNRERLLHAIQTGFDRSDIVILTGGLGPTFDDITTQTAADALGLPMELDEGSLTHIKDRFAAMGRLMTPNNVKQAMFPKGAFVLDNPNGTANGAIVEHNGKTVILLPGPPNELEPLFAEKVQPYLANKTGVRLYSRMVRIYGKGESSVEYALRELIDGLDGVTVAPYAGSGEVSLRVTAQCSSDEEGIALVMPVIDRIRGILGDVVYSDDNETLAGVCGRLLKAEGKTVSAAESLTGGMLMSWLVDNPGSSNWFASGVTAYSNEAKVRLLGVPLETVGTFGAVSAETAKAMAEGARLLTGADFGVSTTGNAGPDVLEDKPSGLAYIAVACDRGVFARELHIPGPRERVRRLTCLAALDLLRRNI